MFVAILWLLSVVCFTFNLNNSELNGQNRTYEYLLSSSGTDYVMHERKKYASFLLYTIHIYTNAWVSLRP